jgi:hypothetical protein
MDLFPDQPPPAKPKLTPEERRARNTDRLATIRLRMAIGHELDARDITTPVAIGEVLGMPAAEASKLLRVMELFRGGSSEQGHPMEVGSVLSGRQAPGVVECTQAPSAIYGLPGASVGQSGNGVHGTVRLRTSRE